MGGQGEFDVVIVEDGGRAIVLLSRSVRLLHLERDDRELMINIREAVEFYSES